MASSLATETDVVLICRSRQAAERARDLVAGFLGQLKVPLHPQKTQVGDMGSQGFDFLGFHFQKLPSKRTGRRVPYVWPSQNAMKRVRETIRQQTERTRLRVELRELVEALNRVIRGWRTYFALAYQLFCESGYQHGHAQEHWLAAERHVVEEFKKK